MDHAPLLAPLTRRWNMREGYDVMVPDRLLMFSVRADPGCSMERKKMNRRIHTAYSEVAGGNGGEIRLRARVLKTKKFLLTSWKRRREPKSESGFGRWDGNDDGLYTRGNGLESQSA